MKENIKAFQIRIPKDIWAFLKTESIKEERSMNVMIIQYLRKMKKKSESKLTEIDTVVS